MGSYNMIAEVGNSIVRLLREKLVPEVITNPDAIGLCEPQDRGDYIVGIYLYDIRECEDVRATGMVTTGITRQKYPPMYVTLSYMITAFSNGDVKYRSGEEQKILGRVMQVLYDHSILDGATLEPVMKEDHSSPDMNVRIQLQNLSYEDKQKIWNIPSKAYKLSLFYKVAPVEIESTKLKNISRVTEIGISYQDKTES